MGASLTHQFSFPPPIRWTNSISLRSDEPSPHLKTRHEWDRAVDLMGRYGIASADAMILNMFLCSNIPFLLTADMEMAECVAKESMGVKRVFVPDSAYAAGSSSR